MGKLSHDQNMAYASGLGPMDESSTLGLQKHPTQEVTNPLKPTKILSSQPNESIAPSHLVKTRQLKKKGNLKKIAREKGQQAQDPEMHVPGNISGSKRIGRLDFSDKEEQGKAKKKLCDAQHKGIDCTPSLLVMAARQHYWDQ